MTVNGYTPSSRRRSSLVRAAVLLALLALPGPLARAPRAPGGSAWFSNAPRDQRDQRNQVSGIGASPLCVGAHDLDVQGATVALSGALQFERVCVTNHGSIQVTDALTLRVSLLYVDPTGSIDGDPSFDLQSSCGQDSATGASIALDARQAVLLGAITSDGGEGSAFEGGEDSPSCGGSAEGGTGGDIAIRALTLTLTSGISAMGGAGGDGNGGDGGPGGAVMIGTALPLPTGTASYVNVAGGAASSSCNGCLPPGKTGATGNVSIAPLDTAARAALPPPPAPLIATLGLPPARAGASSAPPLGRCGSGDLDIGAGQRPSLAGVHRYAHVCIHDGGVLRGGPHLTLVADTIDVDARSRIAADGTIHGGAGPRVTGRYADGGENRWPRAILHAGVAGADGTSAQTGAYGGGDTIPAPTGGGGGGSLALIARRVRIAGIVSADGSRGGDGGKGGFSAFRGSSPSTGNGGGGSGGGVYIRADTLQLSGRISVLGGRNGAVGGGPIQPPGTAGRVTLLVDTLVAPAGDLPIDGVGLLGRTLPSDPVPPPADPMARYADATDHALSGPFLAYWRAHGGLDVFGYPRTEPFVEGGGAVQYTDRFRLEWAGGRVRTAPLGRLLTAGRAFSRVAAPPSTAARSYFPATGHTLSGLFLAYWRAHDGADLLGAPLSEVMTEGNDDGSGRRYPLQWFERGRLEYHAEHAGTRYAVQIGLLGVQALRLRGWLP